MLLIIQHFQYLFITYFYLHIKTLSIINTYILNQANLEVSALNYNPYDTYFYYGGNTDMN